MRCIPVFLFIVSTLVTAHTVSIGLDIPQGLIVDLNLDFKVFEGGVTFTNALPFKLVSYLNPFYGDFVFIPSGFLKFDLENVSLKVGRFEVEDDLDSENPLFLSKKIVNPMSVDLVYRGGNWRYRTKWIELYKDRGVNYKSFVLDFKKFRIGYQESTVYIDGKFNLDYFALPAPTFFIQHFLISDIPAPRGENANSMIGGFLEFRNERSRFYLQILVDDFNMNRFLYPDRFQNPDKIAWNLGMDFEVPFGKISIGSAGATKYTFENTIPDLDYGYFYYPFYEYDGVPIPLDENYIGYSKGENNITFFLRYSVEGFKVLVEYTLTGDQSPLNPWHEFSGVPEGTHLLDDEKAQKELEIKIGKILNFGNLSLEVSANLSWIWNVLEIVPAEDGGPDVLKPSDENAFESSFGLKISLEF